MRKAIVVVGVLLVAAAGYVLWGAFVYAPLLGSGWAIALAAFSAVCLVLGVLSVD